MKNVSQQLPVSSEGDPQGPDVVRSDWGEMFSKVFVTA